MLQDACTKDVFREMDGFLVLMSVLSTIHPTFSQETRADTAGAELLESTRLVFMILSEALHKHNENAQYFKVRTCVAGVGGALTPHACPSHTPTRCPANARRRKWASSPSRRRRSGSSPTRARSSRR